MAIGHCGLETVLLMVWYDSPRKSFGDKTVSRRDRYRYCYLPQPPASSSGEAAAAEPAWPTSTLPSAAKWGRTSASKVRKYFRPVSCLWRTASATNSHSLLSLPPYVCRCSLYTVLTLWPQIFCLGALLRSASCAVTYLSLFLFLFSFLFYRRTCLRAAGPGMRLGELRDAVMVRAAQRPG